MIEQTTGDVLSVDSGILVHGCNCHGVMGGGIAALIRAKWPSVYEIYRKRYEHYGLQLGDIIAVGHPRWANTSAGRHLQAFNDQLPEDVIVVNAMTQFDFGRDPSRVYVDYDAISAAFVRIRILARDSQLAVHFPQIGCGLARGKWEDVAPRIDRALGNSIQKTVWVLPQ